MTGPGFTLRPAASGDADLLQDLVVAAVNWDPARAAAASEQVLADPRNAHYAAGWMRPGDVGVVALDGSGRPIGAAWLRCFTADDPGYGFVADDVPELSIGVVDGWRGRGVGRALLRAVVRSAAEQGAQRISLSVERANRARELYLDEGFVVVEEGRDADTMVLDLAAVS